VGRVAAPVKVRRSASRANRDQFGPFAYGVAEPTRREGRIVLSSDVTSQDWLAHHALVRPRKVAVYDLGTKRQFTYSEFNERTDRLASVLVNRFGTGAGDRVAVLARNSSNIFEVQFACWKLGAIFVPLNWRLAGPELQFIVGDSSPRVLLYDTSFAGKANDLVSIPYHLAWEAVVSPDDEYEAALASVPSTGYRPAENTLSTILTVMYTSGTTGRPKGVVITHGMTLWNVINQTDPFRTGSSMVNLVVLPMFHTGGLNTFAIPAIHYGGANVVMPTFDPETALGVLGDPALGITHLQSVPANYQFMSQAKGFADATFPSLVAAGVGGAPPPRPLIAAWLERGVLLQQAFGMTETGSMVMALPREDARRKIGSAGLPFLHNRCRVVDRAGRDVAPGEVGELWMQGPNITPGYWKLPDETAAALTDGWFHSGDAVRQDEEGYFYIVDRWKDMYISGGENVYPAEVEKVIYEIDGVVEVAVIGVPHERWQEVGKAFVVCQAGARLTEADVLRHCGVNLAKFKTPMSVVFVEELPHNATGKIVKRRLRAGSPFAGS
jgi:fatty-acyl-CoA synthase